MTWLKALLICLLLAPAIAHGQALPGQTPAAADPPAAAAEPTSPEAARDMVARLSDAEVRALLLERLDVVAAEQRPRGGGGAGGLEDFLEHATFGVVDAIWAAVVRAPLLWRYQSQSFANFWETLGPAGIGELFGVLLLAIFAGLAAEFAFHRLTRNWHRADADAGAAQRAGEAAEWRTTFQFLTKRLCRDLFGVLLFFLVARLVGRSIISEELVPFGGVIMLYLVALPRLGAAFSRFVLAPHRPDMRVVYVNDDTARFLHRHQIGLFILIGFSIAIVAFNNLNGVAMGQSRLGFWLNLAVHLYVIWIVWRARDGISDMMRGPSDSLTPGEAWFARVYPWFGIGVSVAMWIVVNILVSYQAFELLQRAPHYTTMFLLLLAPLFDTVVRGVVNHVSPPITGEGPLAEAAHQAALRSYVRIGRVIAFSVVVLMIAKVWGIDFHNLAAAGVGAQLAGRLFEIVFVIAIGYLVWESVSLWINIKLAKEQTAQGIDLNAEEPGGGVGGSRLSTVLPLLLSISRAAIVVVFALIALGNIGIDITPLLAGAGIVGLAVGFGAQKLVTDVVSGIFFLVDDAFRTGEFVEVEGTFGTVERISIRSMRLRHHKGPLHTIPYGEIPKLTNYSRDWVIMKLKFTVPFETDPNKVKKIFKKIGAEMLEHEELGQDFMQPFKSQGVFDFDDVGMIIRGKFMSKPGRQFVLRKEIYNRVKQAFEENGIDFARREVRVAIPSLENDKQLDDSQKAALAAAAADAARDATSEPAKA